jgi:Protein of unknown function (DUF2946)
MIEAYKHKLASWMAIFAVLLAFFAPTISQAMSVDNQTDVIYQKVCTEHGSKVIPVELPSGSHHNDGMLGHAGHCAFCCTSAYTPIISSDSIAIVIALIESQAWVLPAYDSPVVQSIYQDSHSPQAPPSI